MFSAATKSAHTSSAALYIEDVFSTYLYTGNGSAQAVNNGIALGTAGFGGSATFFPTTSYAELSTGSAMNFGTGNWTIEFWYQGSPSSFGVMFEIFNGATGQQISIQRSVSSTNAIYVQGGSIVLTTSGATPWDGNWHHHAIVRNGSTVTYYIDGTARGTYSTTLNLTGTASVRIGNYSQTLTYNANGYLSNLRVVSGTAVYTTTFTPPTTPLTAISGTQLLCCQGTSPFVDYSSNAFAITTYNGALASSFGPFVSTTPAKGGLVWVKNRVTTPSYHGLVDTVRGATNTLVSSTTDASTAYTGISQFNSNGFSFGGALFNNSGTANVSWTFAEQPKFFDIVTYTGDGVQGKSISHNLGSVPGMIIIKRTDTTTDWAVWHRSGINTDGTFFAVLNSTAAYSNRGQGNVFGTASSSYTPTSTAFQVGDAVVVNASGGTYVAYLFAHDAGGFGLSGTDNVISCGGYTGNSISQSINLGYEPQFLMIKRASGGTENWYIIDNLRGFTVTDNPKTLSPNLSNAEIGTVGFITPTATGFFINDAAPAINISGSDYIYMAIRRPMKVPTDATTVFQPVAYTGTNVDNRLVNTGIVTDMTMARIRTTTSTLGFVTGDRLRGDYFSATATTAAEATDADSLMTPTVGYGNSFSAMNGFGVGNDATRLLNQSSTNQLAYAFQRRPGFFDEVCYTGTGVARTVSHNLGVAPEMMLIKCRTVARQWVVYSAALGISYGIELNSTAAAFSPYSNGWNNTSPTSSVFTVGTDGDVNVSGATFVAYLFATCPGVSKVGSYTGTGATQTINCGFTGGARFVLIKRTDSTGDWYVWDTARGMVSGTDPSLRLNVTTSEVNADSVYTATTGFQVVSTAADINASGGTYIYLAIA